MQCIIWTKIHTIQGLTLLKGIILKDEINGSIMVISKRICISLHKIRTRDFVHFFGFFRNMLIQYRGYPLKLDRMVKIEY